MEIRINQQTANTSYGERVKQLERNYYKQCQARLEHAFLSPEYWQILNKVENHRNSTLIELRDGTKASVDISIRKKFDDVLEPKTIYSFKHNGKEIGYLELIEKSNGAHIFKVENLEQETYKGINKLADRIAVENCLKRGLSDFEITGDAILNSHAAHYNSGKRFTTADIRNSKIFKLRYGTDDVNKIIRNIIKNTPKGMKCETEALGVQSFYLPKNLIKKYIKLSQIKSILR